MKYLFTVFIIIVCISNINAQFTSDANTVALWHLDESSGSIVSDASGKGNNGTATGTSIVNGKFGKARSFNGLGDYIIVSDNVNFDFSIGKQFTLETWIKINSLPSTVSLILGKWGWGNDEDDEWQLVLLNDGRIYFQVNSSTSYQSPDAIVYSTTHVQPGNWIEVKCVWNGNAKWAGIYLNGVEENSTTFAVSTIPHTTEPIYIGTNGNMIEFFNGIIDEVRISNIARTSITPPGITLTYNQIDASGFPLIKSNVTVSTSSGSPITGLTNSNFTVQENGSTQSSINVSTQQQNQYLITYTTNNPSKDGSVRTVNISVNTTTRQIIRKNNIQHR